MITDQEQSITNFRGYYAFLSNFYNAKITYQGYTFHNAEAAFQAMKCPGRAEEFTRLNGQSAKALGRRMPLRQDWEQVKDRIMYEVCLAKFSQNDFLGDALLATGERQLIEGNSWNDTEWGMCGGRGKNKLGKILMRIRTELRCSRQAEEPIPSEVTDEKVLYKAMAHINSLKGAMAEISVLKILGNNDFIVDYRGIKCHAIFNWFVGQYYADDLYAVIKEES